MARLVIRPSWSVDAYRNSIGLPGKVADGLVAPTIYPQVPPKVEYCLTVWDQSLCPALDALLTWAAERPEETDTQDEWQEPG